jgi:hypothetical protein
MTSLFRISAAAGISGALITFVFGILHPKGTSDLGSVSEWMSRVHSSDVWIVVHFALAVAAVLMLVAIVGISRSFPEEGAASWAGAGLFVAAVTTTAALATFLIDGAVVKETADRFVTSGDTAARGAALLATDIGFILVAGLQIMTGITAAFFGIAGLMSRAHPVYLAWLALGTAVIGIIPGAAHYLFGSQTWSVSASYVSSALFAIWILAMSRRLWSRRGEAFAVTAGAGEAAT